MESIIRYSRSMEYLQVVDVFFLLDKSIMLAEANLGRHVPGKIRHPVVHHANCAGVLSVHEFDFKLVHELSEGIIDGGFLFKNLGPDSGLFISTPKGTLRDRRDHGAAYIVHMLRIGLICLSCQALSSVLKTFESILPSMKASLARYMLL